MIKEKNKLNAQLSSLLKEKVLDAPVQTPPQKVVPIKKGKLIKEKQLAVYMPEELIKALKHKSADLGISIKSLITQAIINYYKINLPH